MISEYEEIEISFIEQSKDIVERIDYFYDPKNNNKLKY